MQILTLNKIAACGTDRLAGYTVGDAVENPDAILVRSAAMHDMELPESVLRQAGDLSGHRAESCRLTFSGCCRFCEETEKIF